MIQAVPFADVKSALLQMAYDTGSICTYAFVAHLLAKEQTAERHHLAALLLSHPLCHLPEAYRAGFFTRNGQRNLHRRMPVIGSICSFSTRYQRYRRC